jgi:putative SOS response-associated peptidase YedK
MLSFWSDPHFDVPPFAADGSVVLWDAIARVAMPARRRVARPLDWLPVIIPTATGVAVVQAYWGLQARSVPDEQDRAQALRYATFGVDELTKAPLKDLWRDSGLRRRCLVPATGYIANVAGTRTAFLPFQEQPSTFAGVFCSLSRDDLPRGPLRWSFGIITRQRCDRERFGHRAPVVIGVNSRETWLKSDADQARTLLGNAQPKLRDRVLRSRVVGQQVARAT